MLHLLTMASGSPGSGSIPQNPKLQQFYYNLWRRSLFDNHQYKRYSQLQNRQKTKVSNLLGVLQKNTNKYNNIDIITLTEAHTVWSKNSDNMIINL